MSASVLQCAYARFLGLRSGEGGVVVLPFAEGHVGNPLLPALHGGVIGALLEVAAFEAALTALPSSVQPRTIGLTVAYLRPGRSEETFAAGRVVRRGKRVGTVLVEAWQSGGRDRPIATATVQLLFAEETGADGLPLA